MGIDAPWHWIILALIVIALFGARRLPDAARSLGQSLRIFKTEIKNDPRTSTRPELTAENADVPDGTAAAPNGSRAEVNAPAVAVSRDAAGRDSTS